jgi:hypothetical protein
VHQVGYKKLIDNMMHGQRNIKIINVYIYIYIYIYYSIILQMLLHLSVSPHYHQGTEIVCVKIQNF